MCNINLNDAIIESGETGEFPSVYLIDEYHHHDISTNDNIQIARHLIRNNNVSIVALEGCFGGYEYHNGYHKYEFENYVNCDVILELCDSDYTVFYEGIRNENVVKIGVDNQGLSDEISADTAFGASVPEHRNQLLRSKHFIITLFHEYKARNLTGNLILNCGSSHNDHILDMVKQNSIYGISQTPPNYYRIRSLLHPLRM